MSNRFFSNTACEYFPCHEGVDPDEFNCLFCFCPLYALGERCGGDFRYTEQGVKDCSSCTIPHRKDTGFRWVEDHCAMLCDMAREPGM